MARSGRGTLRRTLVFAVALVLNASGCGGDGTAPDRSTLTVLYPTDERGLGPEYDSPAQFLVFLPLVDRDGDGIRERGGEPFRFGVLATGDVEREAVYVQEQLARVGVRMEIERLSDWAQVFRRIRAGGFGAAIAPLLMELTSPMGQLGFFGEDSYVGYGNPQAHELLSEAADTRHPEELDRIYGRLMDVFRADVPATLLHPVPSTHVATTRLVGLSSPYRADPVWYMEHLRLEAAD